MSRKKPIDKTQIRERRNRMLASAAAARLSLTEGVREMRAISGMTQEEFARHRGVSARVIKAIELGQGNPTMATLNRIGEFFGLEVAFVPIMRETHDVSPVQITDDVVVPRSDDTNVLSADLIQRVMDGRNTAFVRAKKLAEALADLDREMNDAIQRLASLEHPIKSSSSSVAAKQAPPDDSTAVGRRIRMRKRPRST